MPLQYTRWCPLYARLVILVLLSPEAIKRTIERINIGLKVCMPITKLSRCLLFV